MKASDNRTLKLMAITVLMQADTLNNGKLFPKKEPEMYKIASVKTLRIIINKMNTQSFSLIQPGFCLIT
jgi:hypothetical protein